MQPSLWRRWLFLLLVSGSAMWAGPVFTFESYSASAGGTVITGQDGWYIPPVGGIDGNVYTYAGNALGMSANPQGGANFAGGVSPTGSPPYVRAQHGVSFGGSTLWTITADITAGSSTGFEQVGIYPGGFSLQSTSAQAFAFNSLADWEYASPGTTWSLGYQYYDAGGGGYYGPVVPGAAWQGLVQGHWYREGMTIDLLSNRVLAVWIQDLSGGPASVYNPADWYLLGGAGGVSGVDAIRLFVGNTAGNMFALDNVSIQEGIPEPATLGMLAGGLALVAALARRRRSK